MAHMGISNISKEINRGTSQGGILSPPICYIDIEDCLSRIPERGPTEGSGYADDIKIIGTGIDEHAIAANLQRDLQNLEEWAAENALAFNPDKTKVMLFTREKNITKPKIYLHGTVIEYVKDFKYLGVTLYDKLNWKKHIK